jgi:hypothetical protein
MKVTSYQAKFTDVITSIAVGTDVLSRRNHE